MKKVRLAVVNSHPIQYFAPLYAYLEKGGQFEVTALYCSDFSLRGAVDPGFRRPVKWDVDLLSGYRAVFLGARAKERVPAGFLSLIVPEVWREVRSGGYDALLLHGHNYFAFLLAFLAAKSKGIPVMMRCETHLALSRSGVKRALRGLLLRTFYRSFDRFLAIGTANHRFYRAMGVADEKIFLVPYTVDNERFIADARRTSADRRGLRHGLGLPADAPLVLYASKLMPRKNPADLLHAAAKLRAKGIRFTLLMVGSGELEAELRALAERLDLGNVVFKGFVNQGELPAIYAASDIFVLPSDQEPWGLVVNEVMCAGLPVVAAKEVGCVADLVADGVNGYTYAARDIDALAGTLERLILDDALRTRMGEASLERISQWSYRECAVGLSAATRGFA